VIGELQMDLLCWSHAAMMIPASKELNI